MPDALLVRVCHGLMAGSVLALALLLTLWLTVLSPPATPALIAPALLVLVLPVLVPVRGLLHGRRYTAAWSSLLSVFYFSYGVAFIPDAPPVRWLALGCTALALIWFVSSVFYVRVTRAPGPRPSRPAAPRE